MIIGLDEKMREKEHEIMNAMFQNEDGKVIYLFHVYYGRFLKISSSIKPVFQRSYYNVNTQFKAWILYVENTVSLHLFLGVSLQLYVYVKTFY